MYFALAGSIALGALSLLLLLGAIAHHAYPQSLTTVEVYPNDVRPPRQWGKISGFAGFGLLLAIPAIYLFWWVFVPAKRLVEVEATARETFQKELKRQPTKLQLEQDPSTEFARWRYTGTAWLDGWRDLGRHRHLEHEGMEMRSGQTTVA